MKRWWPLALRAAVTAAVFGAVLPARTLAQERAEARFYASEPISGESAERRISVALLAGYGLTLNPSSIDGLNGLGMGFGVRGGVNLDRAYVGLRLQFFLGSSERRGNDQLDFDSTLVGLESGFDFPIGRLVVRPTLGLGVALSSAELLAATGSTMDRSSDAIYAAPGLAVMTDIGRRLFLGVDGQVPLVLGHPSLNGLSAMVTTGMRF